MKIALKGFIFLLVEFYFYTKTSSAGLETFFFGWGFLFLTLFLYNTFGAVFEGSAMSSVGRGKGNIMNVRDQHRENVNNSLAARGSQAFRGVFDKANLPYLALFIINVIGYMRIMPK